MKTIETEPTLMNLHRRIRWHSRDILLVIVSQEWRSLFCIQANPLEGNWFDGDIRFPSARSRYSTNQFVFDLITEWTNDEMNWSQLDKLKIITFAQTQFVQPTLSAISFVLQRQRPLSMGASPKATTNRKLYPEKTTSTSLLLEDDAHLTPSLCKQSNDYRADSSPLFRLRISFVSSHRFCAYSRIRLRRIRSINELNDFRFLKSPQIKRK